MYKELQKDYDRKLSWARSLGIGTVSSWDILPGVCISCGCSCDGCSFVTDDEEFGDSYIHPILCADPLAEKFNPTAPAPPELSSWLYLFHAYLQLEDVYIETLEWLNCPGAPPRSVSLI